MLRKSLYIFATLIVVAGVAFWVLTRPHRLDGSALAATGPGNPEHGERIFWAGGCASCHARPEAEGEALLELAGGRAVETDFGTFVAPNISPDPEHGIGRWSEADFTNAMLRGVSPQGEHYYPAFPYPSYARMRPQDVADLFAYLKTLPQVAESAREHALSFPYSMRRGIGLWKLLHMHEEPVVALPAGTPQEVLRGRYLIEGPGHCGECHTPRDFMGGQKFDQWLAGAPMMEGEGTAPNLAPAADGIASWSPGDIAYYLESGFTPDFDVVGGAMADVQRNMARLPEEDRQAIAAYLKAIPAIQ